MNQNKQCIQMLCVSSLELHHNNDSPFELAGWGKRFRAEAKEQGSSVLNTH